MNVRLCYGESGMSGSPDLDQPPPVENNNKMVTQGSTAAATPSSPTTRKSSVWSPPFPEFYPESYRQQAELLNNGGVVPPDTSVNPLATCNNVGPPYSDYGESGRRTNMEYTA